MTPVTLALALVAGLLLLALSGPALLRNAVPALARTPRLAIAVVSAAVVIWPVALLAIGPVLAWAGTGPALLPDGATKVCQKCLAAANPYFGTGTDTAIPAVLLLAVPAAIALALGVGITHEIKRRSRDSRAAAGPLLQSGDLRRVQGYDVTVVDAKRPFALTFPARHGGIVVSTGAIESLTHHELDAVLAHERAHLRQRHHGLAALVRSLATFLRWVPLVAAAADALPHYLEIAADDRARREHGTAVLVGALVQLGTRTVPDGTGAMALHANGPERIAQLVRPRQGLAGAVPAVAMLGFLAVLAAAGVAVHLRFASAVFTACA